MEKYDPNIDYFNKYNDLKHKQTEQEYFNEVNRLHHQCLMISISAALAGLYCYFQAFPSVYNFALTFVIAFVAAYLLFLIVSFAILSIINLTTSEYTQNIKLWVYYTVSALLPIIISFLVIVSKNHESW